MALPGCHNRHKAGAEGPPGESVLVLGAPMAEGPDPAQAAGKQEEHASEPPAGAGRRDGGAGRPKTGDRHSRIVQIGEAALLALVTITAAWAGYAAARWSTTSRVDIARSSTLSNLATRADLSALSTRNFDSSTFAAWFTAYTLNNPRKEAAAERRFRPPFRIAFRAWLATDPLHNPHPPPGPTYMPQYKLPAQAQADAIDNQVTARLNAGNHAGTVSDEYVRITVFLAAVLFLVGIGSSFHLHGVRYALITTGTVLLILSIALILQQPGLPR
jgi:hypothetical protein